MAGQNQIPPPPRGNLTRSPVGPTSPLRPHKQPAAPPPGRDPRPNSHAHTRTHAHAHAARSRASRRAEQAKTWRGREKRWWWWRRGHRRRCCSLTAGEGEAREEEGRWGLQRLGTTAATAEDNGGGGRDAGAAARRRWDLPEKAADST